MNNDFESKLRQALRPVPAPQPLRGRVLAALQADLEHNARRPARLHRYAGWLSMGLAASIVAGVGWGWHIQQQRELAEQLEARRQVIEALRVTNAKLDLAFMTVRDQSS
jgi:hypothetical protein